MRSAVELSDVHDVILILKNGSLVVVDVKIIWCTEDGHNTREAGSSCLSVHAVTSILSFMSTNDGKKIVLFQEAACRRI